MFPLPPMLLLAGSPGPLELLTLFAIVLILFGPRRLPGIARSIGRLLGEWRKTSETFRNQLMEIDTPSNHHSSPQGKDKRQMNAPADMSAYNAASEVPDGDLNISSENTTEKGSTS